MNKKRILTTAMVILLISCVIVIDNKISTAALTASLTSQYPLGNSNMKMGTKPEEDFNYLNAEQLADIDDAPFVKLEKAIKKKADYVEIKDCIDMWIGEGTEGFLIEDTEKLSISKYNIPIVHIRDLKVVNQTYEYLFSDDKAVGYVTFFRNGGDLINHLSLEYREGNRQGDLLYFLENHQDMSFILVTDGFTNYFLGEDNAAYNISTGNKVFWFTVEGDCYQALGADKYSVSYDKIVNEIEIIQD